MDPFWTGPSGLSKAPITEPQAPLPDLGVLFYNSASWVSPQWQPKAADVPKVRPRAAAHEHAVPGAGGAWLL